MTPSRAPLFWAISVAPGKVPKDSFRHLVSYDSSDTLPGSIRWRSRAVSPRAGWCTTRTGAANTPARSTNRPWRHEALSAACRTRAIAGEGVKGLVPTPRLLRIVWHPSRHPSSAGSGAGGSLSPARP